MQDMTEKAKETTTTSDMAKGKKGKAARPIGEVDITGDEASPDAARTAAPIRAQLEESHGDGDLRCSGCDGHDAAR